jgi:hypothetical protein
MIKKAYYVVCDHCGKYVESFFGAEKQARKEAIASGFVIADGKHYCARCAKKMKIK